MNKEHDTTAIRLASILFKLNQGEKLNKKQLAEEFNVHTRTISRDLDERLSFLPFFISDNTYSLKLRTTNSLKLGKSRLISGDE